MKALSLRRGRWTLLVFPPLVWTTDRDSEWFWVGVAWAWRMPGRWQFPVDPQASYGADHVLLDGWLFGPIDLRRNNPLPEDLHGRRPA